MLYARVNARNSAIEALIARGELNKSASGVAAKASGKRMSVSLPADPTDEDLAPYRHVRVREEDRPPTPSGGNVTRLAPAKEPDGHWWVRHSVSEASPEVVQQLIDAKKALIDEQVAWFKRMQAAAADDGAVLKARLEIETTYDGALAVAREVDVF